MFSKTWFVYVHMFISIAAYSPKPVQVTDWPKLDLRLGQVVAVSIGTDGHPVIFHRADRIWTDE